MDTTCRFSIGQLIHHLRFDYRGVIIDVDASFQGSEDWYEQMAKSKPPKEKPWYHVLVDQSPTITYVAERNLEEDSSNQPILHPLVDDYFSRFEEGKYLVDVSGQKDISIISRCMFLRPIVFNYKDDFYDVYHA